MAAAPLKLLGETLTSSAKAARGYSLTKARADLVSGVTVTAIEIPQSMAYAIVAGVPPQYGLYTSFIQGVLGSLFSSSEHLCSGPTNTQALLVAAAVSRLAGMGMGVGPEMGEGVGPDPTRYLQLVFALTLLKGICQLIFGAAQLGAMVRYVSRAVFSGVSAGAGLLILIGQLPALLGIRPGPKTDWLPGVLDHLYRLFSRIDRTDWRALAIAAMCIAIVLAARRLSRFVPGPLLAIVASAILVVWSGWTADAAWSKSFLVGPIPSAIPTFNLPSVRWPEAESLIGGAMALAVMGMLESVVIVKSIAARTGERIDANQEFVAQGLANTISSFFQCIPGSGSFSRSALAYSAGARTRFAAVMNAGFIAIAAVLFSQQARFIPLASLAAILVVISIGLIDLPYIRRIARSSREDFIVCVITIIATLIAPLQYAIFIGVFINLALYIRQSTHLHMAEMVPTTRGQFMELPLQDRTGNRSVSLIQFEGSLFFGIADELQDRLGVILRSPARVAILRLKRTHSIDSTVLHELERFIIEMQQRDRHVLVCGLRADLMKVLAQYGLIERLGKENVFRTGEGVFASVRKALDRARHLVGSSIDATGIDMEEERDDAGPFAYEI